ncbi:MAG: hypothetical protein ACLU48_02015 [Clostridiaceae bacterium]
MLLEKYLERNQVCRRYCALCGVESAAIAKGVMKTSRKWWPTVFPDEDIISRYIESFQKLRDIIPLCDRSDFVLITLGHLGELLSTKKVDAYGDTSTA